MEAPSTGTYGPLTNALSPRLAPTRPDGMPEQPWTNGALSVVQTELSPVTLCLSTQPSLSFFHHMPETGLGGPSYVAISTEQGPKIFAPGQIIEPARLRESWFVVWFAGAAGWTNWDSPWLVSLQRKPTRIRFDANGLHFSFNGPAGYAALMPMYGDYKPAQLGQDGPAFSPKEKKKRVLTWEWHKALPADPLSRARYWAGAMREFPIRCEESFSVDRAHDRVTFRQKFHWLSWNDEWDTKHLKLAPVSPVLASAMGQGFPAEFSEKPFDMEIFTSSGPYYGIQDVDSYDVTLPVLRYVHETEGAGEPLGERWSNAACFKAWQSAHAGGDWESVRARWPELRGQFLRSTPPDWTAFAGLDVVPLEQAAQALGAARLAYRLGDADTYTLAAARFARAITQLAAQQRGAKYFQDNQPWRSMEPLRADAKLGPFTANGWSVAGAKASVMPDLPPDLARLWRDTQSEVGKAVVQTPAVKTERLIPAQEATVFLPGEEVAPDAPAVLLYRLVTEAPQSKSAWPRLTWSDWRTPTGEAWNFGQISTGTNRLMRSFTQPINGQSRATLLTVP